MFETPESSLARRVLGNLGDLARASARPLRRRVIWRYLAGMYVLFYALVVLYLHFIGYHSGHTDFHRVRESLGEALRHAIPWSAVATVFGYFSLLRSRDWI